MSNIITHNDSMLMIGMMIFVVLGILFILMGFLHRFSSSKWFCRKMGWHLEPKAQGFDGCSFTGKCPRCDAAILQDGQGNWF